MNTFEADFEQEKETMMAFMNAHPQFTNKEVLATVGGPTTRRKHFLRTLRAQGKINEVARKAGTPFYTMLSTEVAQQRAAIKRATPNGSMWGAMRALRQFTQADVVAALAATDKAVSADDVRKFASSLLAAGYLKVLQKARATGNRPARYQLVNDSGPLPPDVKRREVVIDANEDRVVHVQGARL
ncbi:hypothetical protein [Roseobacter sp. OBYS 0001]|uniref:hypothetical protein n=1 Tax=Roseobacter sp. OBYS 0001 TaxID=882651 RepID=UPI001BBE6C15|nr:hypothetical protein [Roseobacter sp. OBYS 0001]GIT85436.1 hypothetical protein ROBYS_04520 [Roseobacter sp. OBYS 0001]